MVLLREETDDDMNNFHSVYERIKILTDAGREYANVELPYKRRAFTIAAISCTQFVICRERMKAPGFPEVA